MITTGTPVTLLPVLFVEVRVVTVKLPWLHKANEDNVGVCIGVDPQFQSFNNVYFATALEKHAFTL